MDVFQKYSMTDNKRSAEFFGVSLQTIRNWRKTQNIPLSVLKLMKLERGFVADYHSPSWDGWFISYDRLYGPDGRGYNLDMIKLIPELMNDSQQMRVARLRYEQTENNGFTNFEKANLIETLQTALRMVEKKTEVPEPQRFAVISAEAG